MSWLRPVGLVAQPARRPLMRAAAAIGAMVNNLFTMNSPVFDGGVISPAVSPRKWLRRDLRDWTALSHIKFQSTFLFYASCRWQPDNAANGVLGQVKS
jgi:hypothetical protein